MPTKSATPVEPFVHRSGSHEEKLLDRQAAIATAIKKHGSTISKLQGAFVEANAAREKFNRPTGQYEEKVALQREIERSPERALELADRLSRHREIWGAERISSKSPVWEASRKLAEAALKFLNDALADLAAAADAEAAAWSTYLEKVGQLAVNPQRVESESATQLRRYRGELERRLNVASEARDAGSGLQSFSGGSHWVGPAELGWLEDSSGEVAE